MGLISTVHLAKDILYVLRAKLSVVVGGLTFSNALVKLCANVNNTLIIIDSAGKVQVKVNHFTNKL